MDNCKIKSLEDRADQTWYEDGEIVKGVPKGYIREYTYGRFNNVVVYKYEDCVIVHYKPTGVCRRFKDKDRGFQFARDRAVHCKAVETLLG